MSSLSHVAMATRWSPLGVSCLTGYVLSLLFHDCELFLVCSLYVTVVSGKVLQVSVDVTCVLCKYLRNELFQRVSVF